MDSLQHSSEVEAAALLGNLYPAAWNTQTLTPTASVESLSPTSSSSSPQASRPAPPTTLSRETFGTTTITVRCHKNGTTFRVVRQQVHLTCSYPVGKDRVCAFTTFGGPARMRNHIRTHALRPVNALHLCNICQGRFSRRGALGTHHCGKRRGIQSIDAEFDTIVDGVRNKLEAVITQQREVEEAVTAVWNANAIFTLKQEAGGEPVTAPSFPDWVPAAMEVLASRSEEELKAAVEKAKGSVVSKKRKRDQKDDDDVDAPGDDESTIAESPMKKPPTTPVSMNGSGFSQRFEDSPTSLVSSLGSATDSSGSPGGVGMIYDYQTSSPVAAMHYGVKIKTEPVDSPLDPALSKSKAPVAENVPANNGEIAYWNPESPAPSDHHATQSDDGIDYNEQFRLWYEQNRDTIETPLQDWRSPEQLAANIEVKEEPLENAAHLSEAFDQHYVHSTQMDVHQYTQSMSDLLRDTHPYIDPHGEDNYRIDENQRFHYGNTPAEDGTSAAPMMDPNYQYTGYGYMGPVFGNWH